MVLGIRSKHRRGGSVKVNYIVHVQEIRPWPPSESLRSVQTVLLQWENGNQYSGSFLSTARDSKIEVNESFKLPLILYQDKKAPDKFQKNYLEFSLFLPYKNKAKGQLLGTAVLNLADYGVIEDTLSISALINFKKSSVSSVQAVLVIGLENVEKDSSNSSPNVGLSKEPSLDGSEIASFTDDDASSQSSRTAGSSTYENATSSPSQIEKSGYGTGGFDPEQHRNVQPLSTDASSDTVNNIYDTISTSNFYERSMTSVKKNSDTPFIRSSASSISYRDINGKPNTSATSSLQENVCHNSHEVKHIKTENTRQSVQGKSSEGFAPEAVSADSYRKNVQINDAYVSPVNTEEKRKVKDSGSDEQMMEEMVLIGNLSEDAARVNENGAVNERKELSDCKTRIEMLEEELREAAAIEIGLYSVVAEHASSGNKVHAPARRLSRFYSNACKTGSQAKRASAARAAVSGLVLVSKSCGNDVARLTFWLSNSIMLRAIVSQIAAELPYEPERKRNERTWTDSSDVESKAIDEFDDWDDVSTFIIALEKVESWLFSRIVESVWWQTFTPHMHPTVAKDSDVTSGSSSKKTCGRRNSLVKHEQGNFSAELWKKAFKEACERLCPIRAGGHECGCLSVLVKLVMEQLVNRLDLAMFNAILRESAEEMPTDPLSDPISDSKVLPIPAGKSSFGAGVELKNSIGYWSRWLTDLFGLEDDSTEHSDILGDGIRPKSFKAFRFLHALSDLMMLPFGMLADASTRREVCPMLGPTIIKRVLNSHVPDEFCPDRIPQNINALDTEDVSDDDSGDMVTSFPCTANPTAYSPPPAALLTCVGEVGKQVLQSSRLSTLKNPTPVMMS
ncbi:hypothetical protein DH2020_049694 [Rehmannia glutinosa]|uniref:C2 NT-type domain-containing protein n=1 Tax=Rehmannia glutinosa TaxID=99300 RepID=A0ABR0U253_REHGL